MKQTPLAFDTKSIHEMAALMRQAILLNTEIPLEVGKRLILKIDLFEEVLRCARVA